MFHRRSFMGRGVACQAISRGAAGRGPMDIWSKKKQAAARIPTARSTRRMRARTRAACATGAFEK
jgi:hypothetical protein